MNRLSNCCCDKRSMTGVIDGNFDELTATYINDNAYFFEEINLGTPIEIGVGTETTVRTYTIPDKYLNKNIFLIAMIEIGDSTTDGDSPLSSNGSTTLYVYNGTTLLGQGRMAEFYDSSYVEIIQILVPTICSFSSNTITYKVENSDNPTECIRVGLTLVSLEGWTEMNVTSSAP